MATIVWWNNFKMMVFHDQIFAVTGLSIKTSVKTEDKTAGSDAYVAVKNKGTIEITLEVTLSEALNVRVQENVEAMINSATLGQTGYFYTAQGKLFACKFMLTGAEAQKIDMDRQGRWLSAEMKLTFKQSSKGDGTISTQQPEDMAAIAKQKAEEEAKKRAQTKGKESQKSGTPTGTRKPFIVTAEPEGNTRQLLTEKVSRTPVALMD